MNRDIKILAVFFLAVWLWGIGTVCCYGSTEKGQDKEQNTDQTESGGSRGNAGGNRIRRNTEDGG